MKSPKILTQNRPKYMKMPKNLPEFRHLTPTGGASASPPPPTPMDIEVFTLSNSFYNDLKLAWHVCVIVPISTVSDLKRLFQNIRTTKPKT